MKIIWSPLAIERASEISEYIAQDNPTAAANWVETLFDKVNIQISRIHAETITMFAGCGY